MRIKRSPFYILRNISQIPCLLPFGQMISDHGHTVQLNSAGCYLWHLLETWHTKEELLQLCIKHYGASADEIPLLARDLDSFLEQMSTQNVLEFSPAISQVFPDKYLHIGGLSIRFSGPEEAFPPALLPLLGNARPVHQTIFLHIGSPKLRANGTVLLRNEELIVMEDEERYILLFPGLAQIPEAHLSKDAGSAILYCIPPYTEAFKEQLFSAVRLAYLLLAQKHRMVMLHSASILYQGRAWLFSASSGTGKSTHANLWHSLLKAPVLNGDLNLLAFSGGQPVIHGIPWCGTSGISTKETYPLGGILLLKQAEKDFIEELSFGQKQLLVLQRLISPSWNPQMQEQNLQFTQELAKHILICRLHCTKESSALETAKQKIDDSI